MRQMKTRLIWGFSSPFLPVLQVKDQRRAGIPVSSSLKTVIGHLKTSCRFLCCTNSFQKTKRLMYSSLMLFWHSLPSLLKSSRQNLTVKRTQGTSAHPWYISSSLKFTEVFLNPHDTDFLLNSIKDLSVVSNMQKHQKFNSSSVKVQEIQQSRHSLFVAVH